MKQERIHEIYRFCIIGGISFFIDYGLLYFCTSWLNIHYLYSSAISFIVSVIFNYWLCILYVFSTGNKQTFIHAIKFIGVSIIGLGLNQLCMWIFVSLLNYHYMLAKILVTIFIMLWNYIMKRKVIKENIK